MASKLSVTTAAYLGKSRRRDFHVKHNSSHANLGLNLTIVAPTKKTKRGFGPRFDGFIVFPEITV
jgi:hypothetical protein